MRSNDIERAIDTTLSGLTTTDARKEQLLRAALAETHPCAPQKPEKQSSRVKLKWHFSLSFGLSHMIVAAVVIIVVMLAPALINHEKLNTTQSEDEGWYIIQGHETDQAQIAQAAYKPLPGGNYMFETLEEAFQFAGGLPIPTWMPERYESYQIMLNVMADEKQELLREFCWIILTPDQEDSVIYNWTRYNDISSAMTYVEQNEAGEYVTLSNCREIFCSSNFQYESAVWVNGAEEFFIGGSLTREEAIRMAESVRIP